MRLTYLLMLTLPLGAADLREAVTFRATFDGTTDATVARGDKRIYMASSYKEQGSAEAGLHGQDIELAKGAGRKGDALRFNRKNEKAIFFKADKNVTFDPKNWTGAVSYWLNLTPDLDLEPGFCDPIQVTDKAYNDDAIWTDFTKDDNPRHFRLGVFGDLKAWNPANTPPDKNPSFDKRLVAVKQPPFERGKWTNVLITFQGLGSGKGWAKLYLNGKLQGTTEAIGEPFQWDMAKAAIRLGVNYVGLMDDVTVFERVLTDKEIKTVASGKF